MRKYPFVKQSGLRDCASACILMILKYYGGYVSMEKISDLLKISRDGADAYHIVKVFRNFNFKCDGYKYDNLSSLKLPSIVHIKKHSYNHYVIIWEVNYKKKWVLIGDPDIGNVKVCLDDFMKMWTGNSIIMSLNGIIPKEREVNVYKFLYRMLKPRMKRLIIISSLSLIASFLSFVFSFFIQAFISYITDDEILKIIILTFSILFLLSGLINYFRNLFIIKFNMDFDSDLSYDTFKNIISLPYTSYKRKTTGEVLSYYNDLSIIKDFVVKFSISLFIDIPVIIFITIYLFFTSKHLLFICMFIMGLLFIIYYLYKRKNYHLSSECLRQKGLVNSFVTECVSGFKTVKNADLDDKVISKFKSKYARFMDLKYSLEKCFIKQYLLKDYILNLSIVLTIIYGIYNVKKGLPIQMYITLYFLSSLLCSSFKNTLDFNYDFSSVKSAICHIDGIVKEKDRKLKRVKGNININNLFYSFDDVTYALKNVNLSINSSEKIFISGSSGSGKSTLVKIIKGYYDNYLGSILIGGYEIRDYHLSGIKYVSLKETLFTGKLYDDLNITNGFEGDCEIDFSFDDMLIEEDGFNLSDGQRQRISLARGLKDFNILIIDEGLSNIDTNMERRILKKLISKYKNKTVIFISHRLDNLDLFDRLIKLEKGRVVLDEKRCEIGKEII